MCACLLGVLLCLFGQLDVSSRLPLAISDLSRAARDEFLARKGRKGRVPCQSRNGYVFFEFSGKRTGTEYWGSLKNKDTQQTHPEGSLQKGQSQVGRIWVHWCKPLSKQICPNHPLFFVPLVGLTGSTELKHALWHYPVVSRSGFPQSILLVSQAKEGSHSQKGAPLPRCRAAWHRNPRASRS